MSQDLVLVNDFASLNFLDTPNSDSARKIFVGGLSWVTTEDGLLHYFQSLDLSVDRVMIMRDKVTGRSRGFGFVTLSKIDDVERAIRTKLQLDGRKVEAKRAIPKKDMDNHAKKIFVGGVPISLTNIEFRSYFSSFGKVLETQIMADRESGRSRGFGFVTYDDEKVAQQVLNTTHTIHGKPVEVKRAEPKKPDAVPLLHINTIPSAAYMPQVYPYSPTVYPGSPQVYNAAPPFAYEPPVYIPAQGGYMYIPQHYDMPEPPPPPVFVDAYQGGRSSFSDYETSSVGSRRGSVYSSRDSRDSRDSHERERAKSATRSSFSSMTRRPSYPYSSSSFEKADPYTPPTILRTKRDSHSPFSVRFAEPRSERAFSVPGLLSTSSSSHGGGGSVSGPRHKLTPPLLPEPRSRAGTLPPMTSSRRHSLPPPPSSIGGSRRTDANWRNPRVPRKSPVGTGMSNYSGGVHKYFQ